MSDVINDIGIDTIVLVFTFVILLPAQLLLCFKVKNRIIRLLPAIWLSVATLVFHLLEVTSTGWDSLGYMVLSVIAGFMLLVCALCWGAYGIYKLVKKKGNKGKTSLT